MEFEKLIAISGQGSLFMIISRTGFGLVAESLEDKKRVPVYQSNNVSTLEDISIYTQEGDVPLREVFLKIFEKEGGKNCLDPKEGNDKLKAYFKEILPDFDEERVYVSDMKKVFKWYNQLVNTGDLTADVLKPAAEEEAPAEEEKETKKAGKKKAEAKDEKETKAEEKKKETKKGDAKKTTAKKTAAPKVAKSTGAVKNAPTKKVQTVRKAGGS